MEAAELTGINLKPSMRTSEPGSLQEPTDASSRVVSPELSFTRCPGSDGRGAGRDAANGIRRP